MVRPWHRGRWCAPLPPPHSLHSQPWLLTGSPGARTISGINILFNIAAVSEGTLAAQMALTSISQNCVLQKSDYEIRALRVMLVSQWPVLTDHIKPPVMFSAYFDTKCLLTKIRRPAECEERSQCPLDIPGGSGLFINYLINTTSIYGTDLITHGITFICHWIWILHGFLSLHSAMFLLTDFVYILWCFVKQWDMRHGEIVWLIRHFISTLSNIKWLAPGQCVKTRVKQWR